MARYLVSEPLNDISVDYLAQHGDVQMCQADEAIDLVADVDGLVVRSYTQVNDNLLDKASKLKVVGRAGVALENIDVAACRARGVEVVHTPAANTLAVVDYIIGMLVEINRKFWPMEGYVSPEEFHKVRKNIFGRFLKGLTLGIIGCGRIGSRVGRAAAALGMEVLYNDILDIEVDYPARAVDKETLYAQSDIITIHVPVTELTTKFINAETIARFKPGVQFLNAARGQCVDYPALGEALRSGHVSFAVIDCHDPEPPTEDYPLFGLDNVILTPHIAARVPDAVQNMCDVVHDVVAVVEGRQPQYPAPKE
ncbi:MAG: NAD(P)-dependent oxidoreductase [Phycisphaerae bacterium]